MAPPWPSIALCGVLLIGLPASAQSPFAYDKNQPLDIREHVVNTLSGVRVSLVSFAVAPGERADGFLVAPVRAAARSAGIVWMHSSGAYQQLPDAMLMAHAGAVSLLINPIGPDWSAASGAWPEAMARAVVSVRRGVDLLAARSDVDPQLLAYVGHSYGAMIGADAAAADRRFRAVVFEVGLPGMSVHIRTAPIPFAQNLRESLGPRLDAAMAGIEPLDAIHYVGNLAPAALLFQSARLDPGVTEQQAQAFFDAASEPKALRWYDTGHDVLDIAAISDRARFLASHLGLKPIDPLLKEKIGIHGRSAAAR